MKTDLTGPARASDPLVDLRPRTIRRSQEQTSQTCLLRSLSAPSKLNRNRRIHLLILDTCQVAPCFTPGGLAWCWGVIVLVGGATCVKAALSLESGPEAVVRMTPLSFYAQVIPYGPLS